MASVETTIYYTFRVNSQEFGQIINALCRTGNPKATALADEMKKHRDHFRSEMLRKFAVEMAQKEVES